MDVTRNRTLPDWTMSHVRVFEFWRGVPELVIPDNEKAAVKNVERRIIAPLRNQMFFLARRTPRRHFMPLLAALNERPSARPRAAAAAGSRTQTARGSSRFPGRGLRVRRVGRVASQGSYHGLPGTWLLILDDWGLASLSGHGAA